MKKSTIFIAFLIFNFVLSAQVKTPKGAIAIGDKTFWKNYNNPDKFPDVTGKLINYDTLIVENIQVSYSIVSPFYGFQTQKVTKVKSDGTFSLELDYAQPYQQIWLQIGDLFYSGIYVNSGLQVELDLSNKLDNRERAYMIDNGIRYLGEDGELNTYFKSHYLFKAKQRLAIERKLKKMETSEYFGQCDSLQGILESINAEFFKKYGDKYAWLIENERLSKFYKEACVRSRGKIMDSTLWNKVKKHQVYLASNDGISYLNNLNWYLLGPNPRKIDPSFTENLKVSYFNDEEKVQIKQLNDFYRNMYGGLSYDTLAYNKFKKQNNFLLKKYRDIESSTHIPIKLNQYYSTYRADIQKIINWQCNSHMKNDSLRTIYLYDMLSTKEAKAFMDNCFEQQTQEQKEINKILAKGNKIDSNVHLGNAITELPFGARLYESNQLNAKELLVNLRKNFRGKALLVDCWATWCRPCVLDMPYSKKLKEDAKDLPIEFVYLCTSKNSSIEKWKSRIVKLEQPGTHMFVNQETMSELMAMFSFSGYPSYVFIDLKGNYKPDAISRIKHLDKEKLQELLCK